MKADYVHKDSTTLVQDELVKNELNQIELQYNASKQQKFNELLKENNELKKQVENYKKLGFKHLQDQNVELNKKYVNAVADYVHKDTLTATDYVELNKDNELLMSYNQALLKENNELKKQLDKAHDELYSLKNKYNIRLLNQISENIEPDCEDYYLAEIETKAHKYDLTQNQQKEFINYLQEELNVQIQEESIGCEITNKRYILEEILQKYKEIIGVSK